VGLSLAQLSDAMNDDWITGTAKADYQVKGICGTNFWQSADGSLQFDIRDGTLPHVSLAEDQGPLRIVRLSGQARLHETKIDVTDATLNDSVAAFKLSGTASLNRVLDLKLAPVPTAAGTRYAITGTLAEPRVVLLPGSEQAKLKQ
jgi:AsmA-like C-terminal region